jgi:hypothetical protein
MIVTSLAIAGGALGFSVKVYREEKRKREYPWTVYAEKIEKKNRKRKRKRKSKDGPFA